MPPEIDEVLRNSVFDLDVIQRLAEANRKLLGLMQDTNTGLSPVVLARRTNLISPDHTYALSFVACWALSRIADGKTEEEALATMPRDSAEILTPLETEFAIKSVYGDVVGKTGGAQSRPNRQAQDTARRLLHNSHVKS